MTHLTFAKYLSNISEAFIQHIRNNIQHFVTNNRSTRRTNNQITAGGIPQQIIFATRTTRFRP